MHKIVLLVAVSCSLTAFTQVTKRVLFIGNSYTGVNNLPQMTANLSLSAGDNLIFETHNPGGQTLQGHFADPVVAGKIAQGNWDFVVLQEQSQRPAFSDAQVAVQVLPYAHKLDSMVREHNPCGETLFYMTWGRKNGDASNCQAWPPVCTYSGMDSLLYLRYMQMAQDNQAAVSPVGRVWRHIRNNHPNLELYSPDESHPSVAGTYAAACTFYTSIFGKDPLLISNDQTLSAADALIIRQAAKAVAYDSLGQWFYRVYDPLANFSFESLGGNQVQFTNESAYATNFQWSFANGQSSQEENPVHQFGESGNFNVTLVAGNGCGLADTVVMTVSVQAAALAPVEKSPGFKVYPNPLTSDIFVEINTPGYFILNDLSGRKLYEFYLEKSSTIDLSQLKPGVYILESNGGKQVILRKL